MMEQFNNICKYRQMNPGVSSSKRSIKMGKCRKCVGIINLKRAAIDTTL